MKNGILRMFSAGVAVLGLVLVGSGLAQQNSSAAAVSAICRASGGRAAAATTPIGCLDVLFAAGAISSSTYVSITNAVANDRLTNNLFAIFVADVINGAGGAPQSAANAANYLAGKGLEVPTGVGSVDGETIAGILTASRLEVSAGYRAALSGITR